MKASSLSVTKMPYHSYMYIKCFAKRVKVVKNKYVYAHSITSKERFNVLLKALMDFG